MPDNPDPAAVRHGVPDLLRPAASNASNASANASSPFADDGVIDRRLMEQPGIIVRDFGAAEHDQKLRPDLLQPAAIQSVRSTFHT